MDLQESDKYPIWLAHEVLAAMKRSLIQDIQCPVWS